jgi:predicted nucleic acid-binding protein
MSRIGQTALHRGDVYRRIYTELSTKDSSKRKHESHMADAIIGATAHAMGIGLVTADVRFYQVMQEIMPESHMVLWKKR